jgi:hypothetical protein
MSKEEISHEVAVIQQQSTTIVELTDQLLTEAEDAIRKEGGHE